MKDWLSLLSTKGYGYTIRHKKRREVALTYQNDEKNWLMRLPWVFPDLVEGELFSDYIQRFGDTTPEHIWICLIQAGYATLGRVERLSLVDYKRISYYMVRKKQGKSQLTYLNKKGKSRAGARIRLRNTQKFFDELHTVIQDWATCTTPQCIFLSSTPRLWGALHQRHPTLPLFQSDMTIHKIPLTIHRPRLSEIKRVLYHIRTGTVREGSDPLLAALFQKWMDDSALHNC